MLNRNIVWSLLGPQWVCEVRWIYTYIIYIISWTWNNTCIANVRKTYKAGYGYFIGSQWKRFHKIMYITGWRLAASFSISNASESVLLLF